MDNQVDRSGTLITAGILLGIGAAAFFDGIVLHQILQWHHMITSVRPGTNIPNLEVNTLWDGLFHAGAYVFTVVGVIYLWRAQSNSNRPLSLNSFIGSLLVGAGLFDFVEGMINHQILGIHHVKPGPNQLAWDIGFLLLGATLAIVGWIILKNKQQKVTT